MDATSACRGLAGSPCKQRTVHLAQASQCWCRTRVQLTRPHKQPLQQRWRLPDSQTPSPLIATHEPGYPRVSVQASPTLGSGTHVELSQMIELHSVLAFEGSLIPSHSVPLSHLTQHVLKGRFLSTALVRSSLELKSPNGEGLILDAVSVPELLSARVSLLLAGATHAAAMNSSIMAMISVTCILQP
jgi:hypothetical protein